MLLLLANSDETSAARISAGRTAGCDEENAKSWSWALILRQASVSTSSVKEGNPDAAHARVVVVETHSAVCFSSAASLEPPAKGWTGKIVWQRSACHLLRGDGDQSWNGLEAKRRNVPQLDFALLGLRLIRKGD